MKMKLQTIAPMDFVVTMLLILLSLSFCYNGNRVEGASSDKAPVRTIKTNAGVYSCIDIRKQSTLSHSLLENHDIQMRPTFPLKKSTRTRTSSENRCSTALDYVDCPQGTVPIRRFEKEDAKTVSLSNITSIGPMLTEYPGQHLAILRPTGSYTYYGVEASSSINNPTIREATDYTMSQMWIQNGVGDQMNGLQAGWIVSPQLNGDNHTRLFTLSTVDGYKTKCFNTHCSSFVQVDTKHPVDAPLGPISIPGGTQSIINLSIIKDIVTKNWLLLVDHEIYIGYWPATLFPQLNEGGSYVAWGGLAYSPPGKPSPPMGTGNPRLIFEDLNYVAYFANLTFVDASHHNINPDKHHFERFVDADTRCYNLVYTGYKGAQLGHAFKFGGPGGYDCGL